MTYDDWENEGDDDCDHCMRSGVVVVRRDKEGLTVCRDCEDQEYWRKD